MRANKTYSEAKHQFSVRNRDVLIGVFRIFLAQTPHKLWSALKSAVFGLSSSLTQLVVGNGGLVCESVCKADLLSDILTASKPGSLLIFRSLVIHLLDLYHLCLQVE